MDKKDIEYYRNRCRVDEKFTNEDNPEYPFCSPDCHTLWADTNRPIKENNKPVLTISEMQERLLYMKPQDTATVVSS